MPLQHIRFRERRLAKGFTLVELLTVISIIVLLTGFSAVFLTGTSMAKQLATSGNLVVDLLNMARQYAIAENTLTAFVMVDTQTDPSIDNRLFVVMGYSDATQSWVPVSKWQTLSPGILVDLPGQATGSSNTSSTQNFPYSGLVVPTSFGPVTYQGRTFNSNEIRCEFFRPDGSVYLQGATPTPPETVLAPPVIRLVPGVLNGQVVRYEGTTGGAPADYYCVTLNLYTGLSVIDRP